MRQLVVRTNDNASLINGSYLLISRLGIETEGVAIPMNDNVNMSVALRILLRYSSSYIYNTAEDQFYYIDDTMRLAHVIFCLSYYKLASFSSSLSV